jgi:hypothetical protein
MKSNVVLKFLILAVIVCMIMSAWAAAWSAFVSIVWNTVLFPTARCCTRMAQAWMQVSSNPSNYRLREPYDSLGVLRHPYFHDSLNLTLVERHILVALKCTGLFVVLFICSYTSTIDSIFSLQAVLCNCASPPICRHGPRNKDNDICSYKGECQNS